MRRGSAALKRAKLSQSGDGMGSIQEGRVIDMYFPTQEEVQEWMEITGGRVYVQLIDAEG